MQPRNKTKLKKSSSNFLPEDVLEVRQEILNNKEEEKTRREIMPSAFALHFKHRDLPEKSRKTKCRNHENYFMRTKIKKKEERKRIRSS